MGRVSSQHTSNTFTKGCCRSLSCSALNNSQQVAACHSSLTFASSTASKPAACALRRWRCMVSYAGCCMKGIDGERWETAGHRQHIRTGHLWVSCTPRRHGHRKQKKRPHDQNQGELHQINAAGSNMYLRQDCVDYCDEPGLGCPTWQHAIQSYSYS